MGVTYYICMYIYIHINLKLSMALYGYHVSKATNHSLTSGQLNRWLIKGTYLLKKKCKPGLVPLTIYLMIWYIHHGHGIYLKIYLMRTNELEVRIPLRTKRAAKQKQYAYRGLGYCIMSRLNAIQNKYS